MGTNKRLLKFRYLVIILLIIYVLGFVPLPYIVQEPGSAEEVGPMVIIEQPVDGENGVIMLTTVRATTANVLKYLQGRLFPGYDVYKREQIYRKGETRAEYLQRQASFMLNSQSNATIAVYHHLNIPYQIMPAGVRILQVYKGFPAEKVLKPGDEIIRVEGQEIRSLEELMPLIQAKDVGETLLLQIRRGQSELESEVELGDLAKVDDQLNESRPGLGVTLAEMREIVPDDLDKRVTIAAGDIGGPSAGLMFALQIIDQLTPEDLTQGYRIAGTGEISPDGVVSRIGGVHHKVVAAHRERADIFFTPEDNAKDAMAKAQQIGTDMKIITVRSLSEAVEYLNSLPPKEAP